MEYSLLKETVHLQENAGIINSSQMLYLKCDVIWMLKYIIKCKWLYKNDLRKNDLNNHFSQWKCKSQWKWFNHILSWNHSISIMQKRFLYFCSSINVRKQLNNQSASSISDHVNVLHSDRLTYVTANGKWARKHDLSTILSDKKSKVKLLHVSAYDKHSSKIFKVKAQKN